MIAVTRRMMLDTVLSAAAAGVFVRPAFAGSQVGATARPRIVVFDVNETLLDIGALAPQFQRLFGNSGVAQEWFSNVVLYSQVATIAGPYVDFGTIARARGAGHDRGRSRRVAGAAGSGRNPAWVDLAAGACGCS